MTSLLRDSGLTLVLCLLFLGSWIGQAIFGWHEYNETSHTHGGPQIAFTAYLTTGHFVEATGENWESEFLQMGLFVVLTSFLFQKGSPESNDPDKGPAPEPAVTKDSPWPVRAGGMWLALYKRSLGIVFLLLFAVSITLHLLGGHVDYNEDRREHGEPPATISEYARSPRFWFESFQNWQSEFLSLAAMVYLAVYLRYAGSAESKSVATPHHEHGN